MMAEHHSNIRMSLPRIISWNTTFSCNLRCAHCYLNAGRKEEKELNTNEGKRIIDQIAEVSQPILVLSGGEPLLRQDIYELAEYGVNKGLRIVMGTNGTLITDQVAGRLKTSGISKVGISLDSTEPKKHDSLRGFNGAWRQTIKGIEACRKINLDFQIHTTVTRDNHDEIDEIIDLAQQLGASDFHLFFLVPSGRAGTAQAITPEMCEKMLDHILEQRGKRAFEVKPTCAPQYVRIAKEKGIALDRWGRGCLAGINYCRIYPTGEVTPCPYLSLSVGDLRQKSFKEIWFNSEVFSHLRNFKNLKGRCGVCKYQELCGGCRARAYGYSDLLVACGGLTPSDEIGGDYLAEDPFCTYKPKE
jgi:radical SAM protein with 4Fe4S-binding SPASM domain